MATKCCARNIVLDSILYPDPSSQCDTICLTVADPSFLPDPATDCEFAEVRFVDLTGFALAIYQWDGFSWQVQVGVIGAFSGSDITDVNYQTFGDWTATLNGNAVSGAGTYTFDPAVQSLDVVFINGACEYEMEPAIAIPVARMSVILSDPTGFPFDPTDLAEWNAACGGLDFTDLVIDGATYTFYGGTLRNGVIYPFAFQGITTLIVWTDLDNIFQSIGEYGFEFCTSLNLTMPALTSIDNSGCANIASLANIPLIETLGFGAIGGVTGFTQADFDNLTSADVEALKATGITQFNAPLLTNIANEICQNCLSLVSIIVTNATSMGQNAFRGCPLLTHPSFPALTIMGHAALAESGVVNCQIPVCTEFLIDTGAAYQFADCPDLEVVYAPLLATMGTPADDDVFFDISGQSITITVPASLQTIDGGNPDGDLVYLAANNTATIIYV